jgi:mRNA-degrading endonuclease HigB of HigAB toxin-antitoxin module
MSAHTQTDENILPFLHRKLNIENACGARHPETKLGDWNGAIVIAKDQAGNHITIACFVQGKDFIQHYKNVQDALKDYVRIARKGGFTIQMTPADLKETAGVDVSETTTNDVVAKYSLTTLSLKFLIIGLSIAVVVVVTKFLS